MKTLTGISSGTILGGVLGRYIPTPASRNGNQFLNTAGKVASQMVSAATSAVPGLSSLDPQYLDMITMQKQIQDQMLTMTFASNMIKSEHETRMAAVRNIRVS